MPIFVPKDRPEGVAFSPVPPGGYRVRVSQVEAEYSNSGSEMLNWKFEIIDSEDYDGRALFHRAVLVEKAMIYPDTGFYDMLKVFGMLEQLEEQDIDLADLAQMLDEQLAGEGATCYVTVGNRRYQGKVYNEITRFQADKGDEDPDDLPYENGAKEPEAAPAPQRPAAKTSAPARANAPRPRRQGAPY